MTPGPPTSDQVCAMDEPAREAFESNDRFRCVPLPPERRLVLDTLRLGQHKPMMHGFLELDVTRARELLRAHLDATGEALSFTAFVLASVGLAIAEHPEVHPVRDWLGRLVIFEDVDATTMVEVEVEGRRFALAHVIRGINRRSVHEIHAEIRAVQAAGLRSVSRRVRVGSRLLLMLPGFLRRLLFGAVLRFPRVTKRRTGTLLVTSVGMFSGGATGWGVSAPGIHNLSLVVGGIASRCAAAGDAWAVCETLCLTVSANHDLIDGAPLSRFVRDLAVIMGDARVLHQACAPQHPSRPMDPP